MLQPQNQHLHYSACQHLGAKTLNRANSVLAAPNQAHIKPIPDLIPLNPQFAQISKDFWAFLRLLIFGTIWAISR